MLGCVNKVDLSITSTSFPIIVDGWITNQPGPDTVRLSRGYPADGGYYAPQPVDGAIITITDDTGKVDSLVRIERGTYITQFLNGTVGRFYQLKVLIKDPIKGPTFAISTRQQLVDAGSVDSIYYEFTTRINSRTGLSENGFNVFIDSSLNPSSSRRMKWSFFGTYTVTTNPAAFLIPSNCGDPPCPLIPLPCSDDCLCCVCWYTTFEKSPIISTPSILGGSQLDYVFMQFIPINDQTFFDQYRVEIRQMELSKDVFEFYEAIKNQEVNGNSVFQPPFFKIDGNMSVDSGPEKIIGSFAASTVAKRHIYIPRNAVPYKLSNEILPGDCRGVAANATLTMPSYWN